MIEIAAMASSLVASFLVPLLKKGAEGLAAELQQKTTQSVADALVGTAKRLWGRIKGSAGTADEQSVVEMFERQPELMKEALEKVVRARLEADDGLRAEVGGLLEAEARPGTPNWQLMGEIVGAVDARGATISGGNVAGVIYNADPRSADPRPADPRPADRG